MIWCMSTRDIPFATSNVRKIEMDFPSNLGSRIWKFRRNHSRANENSRALDPVTDSGELFSMLRFFVILK